MRALSLLLLLLSAAPAASETQPGFVRYTPPSRMFSCDIPDSWKGFELKTPGADSVHIIGPRLEGAPWRAAYHVHLFEKGKPGYLPPREFIKRERERSGAASRRSTRLNNWRVEHKQARQFEIREERLLPQGVLPAAEVSLHHFYTLVPAGKTDYIVIKLSTTEEAYLRYREELRRFLASFNVIGY